MGRRGLLVCAALAALAVVPATLAAPPSPLTGWLQFGNDVTRTNYLPASAGIADPSALHYLWSSQVKGTVTAQPLVVRDMPNPGDVMTYVVTADGYVEGINQNGFVVLERQVGSITLPTCSWLPGNKYGVTGTPALDPATQTLYLADAQGYVHAMDASTLAERPGWPVRIYKQTSKQLVWGAVSLIRGKLYFNTGLLCDLGVGRVFSIDLASRKVKVWTAVPPTLGGGGGMWGWGGVAYDPRSASVLVVTGDALPGGKNSGRAFDESAAFAEHIVQLGLDLRVKAANAPQRYRRYVDRDLTGTPVVMRSPGCPPLVAGESKNGNVYVWRLNRIKAGPWWKKKVAAGLNGQPAWSPLTRSLYVVGHARYFRFQLSAAPACTFKQVWAKTLVGAEVNGPPLVVGNTIWFTVAADQTLWAVDATTGDVTWRGGLAEPAYAPPAIVDGRVYVAAFRGLVTAFG